MKSYGSISGKLVCAICAGPTALMDKVGVGRCVTSFPSFREKLEGEFAWKGERVVSDGNLVTSQGPGTGFEFALEIVRSLMGAQMAESLVGPVIVKI